MYAGEADQISIDKDVDGLGVAWMVCMVVVLGVDGRG